jgi:hypothetical protein
MTERIWLLNVEKTGLSELQNMWKEKNMTPLEIGSAQAVNPSGKTYSFAGGDSGLVGLYIPS